MLTVPRHMLARCYCCSSPPTRRSAVAILLTGCSGDSVGFSSRQQQNPISNRDETHSQHGSVGTRIYDRCPLKYSEKAYVMSFICRQFRGFSERATAPNAQKSPLIPAYTYSYRGVYR